MSSVSARPNRTIQVTVRAAELNGSSDELLRHMVAAVRSHDLLGRIIDPLPDDAVEVTFLRTHDQLVEGRGIAQGIDVHVHIDLRGEPKGHWHTLESLAITALNELFGHGDFCILLTINHAVSVIIDRRPSRQDDRIREVS